MTWNTITANINGKDYSCHYDGRNLSIPYEKDLLVNSLSIKLDDEIYQCQNITNIADRDELLLIELIKEESDESAQGRNKTKSSRK